MDLRLKYLIRLLDTLTTVFDTHEVYFYLILNYNKPAALLKEIWFVLALLHALGASVLTDRGIIQERAGRAACDSRLLHPEETVADNKLTSVVSCQYTVVLIVQMYV